MPDTREAARALLAARQYRIRVARQLRQGTGHPDGLQRARQAEANAAQALRAALNAPRPIAVLGEVGDVCAEPSSDGELTGQLTIDTTSPLPDGGLFGALVRVEVVGWPEWHHRHQGGSLKESRPNDATVEAGPPSCGPVGVPEAALGVLDAWQAFQDALGAEERDAVCSACGRHPSHQPDHAAGCPVAGLHAIAAGPAGLTGGLEALRRGQREATGDDRG